MFNKPSSGHHCNKRLKIFSGSRVPVPFHGGDDDRLPGGQALHQAVHRKHVRGDFQEELPPVRPRPLQL
jgi:hypothetical protein